MGKRLVHDYEFNADSNKITFNEIITQDRFLLITNVTDGVSLYTFNDPNNGINATSYDYDNTTTTITLAKDTSAMDSADQLQVFIEGEASTVEMHETYVDPVAKIRVSQPENLIDTDFEYGLQSTKWETLELVKNIPTFFSRNGDLDLAATSITVRKDSDIVSVTCSETHGLSRGTPILVQGTKSNLANGGFVVTSVLDDFKFEYKAKGFESLTTNIFDTYTQIFIASVYQGTEFDLESISAVTSDEATPSKLLVKTQFPTNFEQSTSFFLTNSFAKANLTFTADSTTVDPVNARVVTKSTQTNSTATGETGTWAHGVVQPYTWQPFTDIGVANGDVTGYNSFFFEEEDVTVSQSNRLTFANGHPYRVGSWQFLRYYKTAGGSGLSNLTTDYRHYLAYAWTTDTLALHFRANTSTYNYNPGNPGTTGITKSAFVSGFPMYYMASNGNNYATSTFRFANNSVTNVTTIRGYLAEVSRWLLSIDRSSVFDSYVSSLYWNHNLITMDNQGISSNSARLLYNYLNNVNNTLQAYDRIRFGTNTTGSLFASGRNYNYDASPDNNDNSYNYSIAVPMKLAEDANSIYIANHGFADGSTCTVSNSAGTMPGGLTAGTYVIKKINNNRIAFKTTGGSDVNFTSEGSSDLVIDVTAISLNLNGDTINISENTFSNGDPIVYSVGDSATAIPGLVDDTTYYVYEKTGDKFKLATSATGLSDSSGTKITVDQQSTTADPRINTSGNTIYSTSNSFSEGDIVKVEQITGANTAGFVNGAHYFLGKTATALSLYPTDSDRVNESNIVQLVRTGAGTFDVTKSTMIDITDYGSGEHSFIANFIGAADGVYALDSSYESNGDYIFTLTNPGQVLRRTQNLDQDNNVDLYYNALKINSHGYITGNSVEYTAGTTPIGGLTDNGTYYVKRISEDWFRLSSTEAQALDSENAYISFDSTGSGTAVMTGTSIVGETSGSGTVSITAGSKEVFGTNTNFTSVFNSGDDFNVYIPETLTTDSGSWNTSTNAFTPTDSIGLYTSGMSVFVGGDAAPTGLELDTRYYAYNTGSTVQLMDNSSDAAAGSNPISISTTGTNPTLIRQDTIGRTIEGAINYVNSPTKILLNNNVDSSSSEANYSVNSKLLIRADGFAVHRSYDGGVELIPSTNPDSKMIRQTRKYFRYQSGKGIQVSFAVNFKPTVDIESFTHEDSTGIITTRYPHRINITDSDDGLNVIVKNAANGADYWNGTHLVTNVVNDTSFEVDLGGNPSDGFATGIPTYYVNNWRNCSLRCGLFDDQNGLFFDFDGSDLYAVIRSSTQQTSGTSSVEFKSGDVFGTNTKFTQQINAGENIVIKGQTYVVTKVTSDTLLHILPSYRGTREDGIIITKTVDRKIPQNEWNLDKCDGTGKTGFRLDLGTIQMAYIDYSWYGAGKVRFGFKDQHGVVRYVHEFVHGNFQTEAYMRSGNLPARYELSSFGSPTYVPALAHWGTSVIMDGRFDDDKAYVFTANSLTTTLLDQQADSAGDVAIDFIASVVDDDFYYARIGSQNRLIGYAVEIDASNTQYNSFTEGMSITGTNLETDTKLVNPASIEAGSQPYLPQIYSAEGSGDNGNIETRSIGYKNLLVIDKKPIDQEAVKDTFTVTLSSGSDETNVARGDTNVSKDIPIISIRLAPSVDTNTPGVLGEREIINRMQLILNEVDILTTHSLEVELRVNGQLDNNEWSRVDNPSLSQLIYHSSADEISGGTVVFSFNAQGSEAATRTAVLTAKSLGDVATLGNSIMGGDGVFPDGPDILTVVAKLKEDPSTVTSSNPLSVQGRISWSESQA